jgi:hypothetical protein
MGNIAKQLTLRVAGFTVMALTNMTLSRADVIQSTVELPPASGAYELGGVCVSTLGRCTQDARVSGFNVITRTVQNGDELVEVSANYSADIHMNNGGLPGVFLGHLSLAGTAQFLFLGRDPSVNPLGTFTTELTDFHFQGMLNGNTFEVRKDPGMSTIGSTTIVPASLVPPITYRVSGSLEIFAIYSFNGSPFVTAPPRPAVLDPVAVVPEPGSGVLVGSILAGLIGIASWRRRIL